MSICRDCGSALALALAARTKMIVANLIQITLVDGSILYLTDYETALTINSVAYSSIPMLCGQWSLTNDMTVPSMDLTIYSDGESTFYNGETLETNANNGVFDGAEVLHSKVYMPTAGDVTTYGVMKLNRWLWGEIETIDMGIKVSLKGFSNSLSSQAPSNLYQASCIHTFCDDGCTLDLSDYTTTTTVGDDDSLSSSFIPWSSAPSDYSQYKNGRVEFTSGEASGSSRTISAVSSTGMTLVYPLYETPAAGDSITIIKGCQKTLAYCKNFSNSQHWRGFPYVPQVEDGV